MSLDDYRRKRRFGKTSEPKGSSKPAAKGMRFVIHQHGARRLHFDLRLEMEGVLKCWAVPKGISLDPSVRRLAVHVEDHPLEYVDFEGNIPEGNYGAGAMIVWDHGAWEPIGDPAKGYKAGDLKLRLHGVKLHGAWALVRMRRKPEERNDNWLLIKERDDAVVPESEGDIIRERPESALSGRTLAEVAADGGNGNPESPRKRKSTGFAKRVRETEGAQSRPMPEFLEPALASLAKHCPKGEDWLHEIKFDGYRIVAFLDHGKVILRTRQGHDWTKRFPEIAAGLERLPVNMAILDGEVTALSADGRSNFSALQDALSRRGTSPLVYHLFDAPYLEGFDLRKSRLEDRKALLEAMLSRNSYARVQYVDHVVGGGAEFFEQCRKLGLEGMMSKRRGSTYQSGRSDVWLKNKCVLAEPFVVGGYSTTRGETKLRALLVGYHDAEGRLIYCGRVGSGFSEQSAAEIERRLGVIARNDSPFSIPVPRESGKIFHWVRPQLVAQIKYAGWTSDNILWHPRFEALRDDTEPTEIVRESAIDKREKEQPSPKVRVKAAPRTEEAEPVPQAVLDELGKVRLTSPGKVMYPDCGLTKLDLLRYYIQIADWILPHVVDRPMNLFRCPDGLGKIGFFQKHAGRETPPTVERIEIEDDGELEDHLYIRDLKGLASLVQVAALELHVWGARIDRIEQPDRMIFDLDPDTAVPYPRVIEAARRIRERLSDVGLTSFVKTTGGKGLHVTVPLDRRRDWPEVKDFSYRLAQGLVADYPQAYTASFSKQARVGRIYIDYLRNRRGATAVAPYSTRARPGAPVATPIAWDELTPAIPPNTFTVHNIAERLSALRADPWAEIAKVRQSLTPTMLKKVR